MKIVIIMNLNFFNFFVLNFYMQALGCLINPDAYTLEAMDVVVETEGKHTRGMTIAEKRGNAKRNNNVQVVTSINKDMFIEDMIRLLRALQFHTLNINSFFIVI